MSTPHRAVNGRASSVGVDFGVVTCLEAELRAVLAYIPPYETTKGRRIYNRCRLETLTGETYEIAVVRAREFGNIEAIEVVRDLIEDLSPRWLLVVGIAGGVGSADLDLGDVVVSSRIADFTAEVALAKGERSYAVGGGPIAQEAAIVIANLPALEPAMAGWNKLRVPSPSPVSARLPKATAGVIASSDRLVRDVMLIDTWRGQVRGLRAVEMESAGIYRVASTRNIPFVAIRGISDIVGTHKSDDWREYASHAAASFTAAFLRTRPIEPRATRLDPSTPAPAPDGPLSPRADAPFHIRNLTLTDIRGFDQLILSFPPPPADAPSPSPASARECWPRIPAPRRPSRGPMSIHSCSAAKSTRISRHAAVERSRATRPARAHHLDSFTPPPEWLRELRGSPLIPTDPLPTNPLGRLTAHPTGGVRSRARV